MPSLAALSVNSTKLTDLCVYVWIPVSCRQRQNQKCGKFKPEPYTTIVQSIKLTYIFINGFKKVYFILMFGIVCSSKTTVKNRKINILTISTLVMWYTAEHSMVHVHTEWLITIYLKPHFVLSKLTLTSLLSATQNSIKTESLLSYHLAVAGCLQQNTKLLSHRVNALRVLVL